MIVINDKYPVSDVHLLAIPRNHISSASELKPQHINISKILHVKNTLNSEKDGRNNRNNIKNIKRI